MTTAGVTKGVLAPTRIGAGIIGGLVGGVAFGILMQITDMIPMVAMLVGSDVMAVGWLVHLAIAAFIGASFAVLLGRYATSVGASTAVSAGYGVVWWVLGALIVMPARLGMDLLSSTRWPGRAFWGTSSTDCCSAPCTGWLRRGCSAGSSARNEHRTRRPQTTTRPGVGHRSGRTVVPAVAGRASRAAQPAVVAPESA
jgi:hypothetical protein